MALKNQALTVQYVAWNTTTNAPATGDVANHTIKVVGDGAVITPAASPVEVDATNCPGIYKLALTAGETNYNSLTVAGKSSTAGVVIVPVSITTERGLIDAAISTRSIYAGGAVASVTAPVAATIAAGAIATDAITAAAVKADAVAKIQAGLSTYTGGAVASVTAPVTVGTNSDKAGYSLAAAGLDLITIEAGINARQALAPILAAAAGAITGVVSGSVVIKGGNSAVTRITATAVADGRSAVVLTLPT